MALMTDAQKARLVEKALAGWVACAACGTFIQPSRYRLLQAQVFGGAQVCEDRHRCERVLKRRIRRKAAYDAR